MTKVVIKESSLVVSVDGFVLEGFYTRETDVAVSDSGLEIVWDSGAEANPIGLMLKLPVKTGETWSANYRAGKQTGKINYSMGKFEDVEVPAGKYSSIRVDAEITGLKVKIKTTDWYAPGVGLVKSVSLVGDTEHVRVLKSFKPGKK